MKTVVKIVLGAVFIASTALLFAFPVMWLWNWLMPEIFGLVEITFWQGLGLIMLSQVLFKSSKD